MKKDRHAMVEVECAQCGTSFSARRERVEKGQGRFCGKVCFDVWQREEAQKLWGRKDLAKNYKIGGRYCVRWYDMSGKTKSTPYPRWWWEMNIGEIPQGMIVLYKDGNPLNIDPSNFELGTKSDALRKGNATRKLDTDKWNLYTKKQSDKQRKMWQDGKFEHIKGKGHYAWRGGTSKYTYPKEFYAIRDFIKSRDNYICQICGKNLNGKRSGHVHHRDGDKENSSQDNLLLLCNSCHSKVHANTPASLPIMALRAELHWNR